MSRNLLFLLIFWVPFVLCAQEKVKSPEQFVHEIDKKIPRLLHDFMVPGAAIAIIQNGEIVLQKCYGYADIEKGVKVNAQTGFNLGSISKTIAAWGVMKLVQEGKINLDAPASTYLTQWHFPESAFDSDKVTVRRLLSHTAGLSLSSVSAELSFDHLPTLIEWLNGENDGLGPLEIILEPGTKWVYSGGGYGVLQLIIEQVSGQKFGDFMQTQVLDPLGMTNSSFIIDKKIRAASAVPYDRYGEPTEFGLFTVRSAAGFQSTLEDFVRFAFASLPAHKDHLAYNSVLPVETVQQMQEPQPNTQIGGWKYGLGYQTVHMESNEVFIGHSGTNNGWQASFRIERASMDGFIVFTNGSGGDNICDPLFCELMKWKSENTSWGDCWRKVSIASKLYQVIEDKGLEEMGEAYWAMKEAQADELDFSENQLNELGYHYVGKGELEKASAIFKLNIEAFPNAWNAYDSYGEVLLAQGAREKAIENYRKSVTLNPSNTNGIKVLGTLGIAREDLIVTVPVEHLNLLAGEYIHVTNADWKIHFEEVDGVLAGQDRGKKFTLTAFGNNAFLKEDTGSSLIFDTEDHQAITLEIKGQYKFKKVE